MPNGHTVPVPSGILKPGTLNAIVKQSGLTMAESLNLIQGSAMKFTVLVHEDESGGFWGECLELPGCVSQGDTLDEMDHNIRAAIELVLEVKLEDGEEFANLKQHEPVVNDDDGVRRWELNLPLPQPSSI